MSLKKIFINTRNAYSLGLVFFSLIVYFVFFSSFTKAQTPSLTSTFICPQGSNIYQYETVGGASSTLKSEFELPPEFGSWVKGQGEIVPPLKLSIDKIYFKDADNVEQCVSNCRPSITVEGLTISCGKDGAPAAVPCETNPLFTPLTIELNSGTAPNVRRLFNWPNIQCLSDCRWLWSTSSSTISCARKEACSTTTGDRTILTLSPVRIAPLPTAPVNFRDILDLQTQNTCPNTVYGIGTRCGDGIVNTAAGEECEIGQTTVEERLGRSACQVTSKLCARTDKLCSSDRDCPIMTGSNREPCNRDHLVYAGQKVITCKNNCQWPTANETGSISCAPLGRCGDGIVQQQVGTNPREICDDGANNGRYGYCNAICTGRAAFCGDGRFVATEKNEICDASAALATPLTLNSLNLTNAQVSFSNVALITPWPTGSARSGTGNMNNFIVNGNTITGAAGQFAMVSDFAATFRSAVSINLSSNELTGSGFTGGTLTGTITGVLRGSARAQTLSGTITPSVPLFEFNGQTGSLLLQGNHIINSRLNGTLAMSTLDGRIARFNINNLALQNFSISSLSLPVSTIRGLFSNSEETVYGRNYGILQGSSPADGIVAGARQFNSGDMMEAVANDDPNLDALNIHDSPFTIETWIKLSPNNTGNPADIWIGKADPDPETADQFAIVLKNQPPGDTDVWKFGYTINNILNDNSGVTLRADGRYHHIALVYSRDQVRLFVDGIKTTLSADSSLQTQERAFIIKGNSTFFVDELTVFNIAVRDEDILSIFRAEKAGKCKAQEISGCFELGGSLYNGLVTWWSFNETEGTIVSNLGPDGGLSSSGINDLTISGTPVPAIAQATLTFNQITFSSPLNSMQEQGWCENNNLQECTTFNASACQGSACVLVGPKYARQKLESCSWDCQSYDYCGDGRINNQYEQCDLGREASCKIKLCEQKDSSDRDKICNSDDDCANSNLGKCAREVTGKKYCQAPDLPAPKPQPSQGLTVEGWFKSSSSRLTTSTIVAKGPFDKQYSIEIGAPNGVPGYICFNINIGSSNQPELRATCSKTVTYGDWQHFAGTFDGENIKLYHNGVLKDTQFAPGNIPSSADPLTIGAVPLSGGSIISPLNGWVDELSVYNRALSQAEISAINTAGASGKYKCLQPPAGLLGWWTADGSNTNAASGTAGTWQGNLSYNNDGRVGIAFNFDGTNSVNVNLPNINTTAGGKVTVEFWMYWRGGRQMPFGFRNYNLWLRGGYFGFNTANSDLWGTSANLADRWVHVAAVFNNGDARQNKLYIDGVSQTLAQQTTVETGTTGSRNVSTVANISGWPNNTDYRFIGLIDEVSVYNRELSPDEILEIYRRSSAGKCTDDRRGGGRIQPPAGLVSWWPGDEARTVGGDSFTDDIISRNDARLMVSASAPTAATINTTNSSNIKVRPGSMVFDGGSGHAVVGISSPNIALLNPEIPPNQKWVDSQKKYGEAGAPAISCGYTRRPATFLNETSESRACFPTVPAPPAYTPPSCGNSVVDTGEVCDAGAQNGNMCIADAGKTCTFCAFGCNQVVTRSGRVAPAVCGDNKREGGEQCDGADLAGASCGTLRWGQGTLSCVPATDPDTNRRCKFNTYSCSQGPLSEGDIRIVLSWSVQGGRHEGDYDLHLLVPTQGNAWQNNYDSFNRVLTSSLVPRNKTEIFYLQSGSLDGSPYARHYYNATPGINQTLPEVITIRKNPLTNSYYSGGNGNYEVFVHAFSSCNTGPQNPVIEGPPSLPDPSVQSPWELRELRVKVYRQTTGGLVESIDYRPPGPNDRTDQGGPANKGGCTWHVLTINNGNITRAPYFIPSSNLSTYFFDLSQ